MIFYYIIYFFFFNLIVFLYGRLLTNYLKFNNNIIYIDLIFGIFFLGTISFVLNFFIGLDNIFIKLFLVLLVLFSLKNINLTEFKNYILLLFLSVLIFPLIIYMGPGYDGGLYHLPHQNLIRNEKIIFGGGNIRRFGFGSINEYISALFWLKENFVLLKFLQGTYLVIFFSFIIESVKKLNINIKIIIPIIFLLPFLQRYFTLAYTFTDIATTIFYLITFIHGYFFFLKDNIQKTILNKEIITFLILTFLTVSMKPTGTLIILYCIGVFIFLSLKFSISFKFFLNFLWIYFIFFLWYLKNLIFTGCLVYPIVPTCFNFLEWSSYQNSIIEYASAKSFARQPFAGNEPLINWNWLTDYWLNTFDKFLISFIFINLLTIFFFYILKIFNQNNLFYLIKAFTLVLFLILTILFQENGLTLFNNFVGLFKTFLFEYQYFFLLNLIFILMIFTYLIFKNLKQIKLHLLFTCLFLLISLILWFLNSPAPRFGLSIFFCISIVLVFLLSTLSNYNVNDLKIKNTLLICIFYYLIFISSQSTKIENIYTLRTFSEIYWIDIIKNKKFIYPERGIGPKNEEIIPDIEIIKRPNYGYEPNASDQCWLKLKCYPYKDVVVYREILSYKFMKLADL